MPVDIKEPMTSRQYHSWPESLSYTDDHGSDIPKSYESISLTGNDSRQIILSNLYFQCRA